MGSEPRPGRQHGRPVPVLLSDTKSGLGALPSRLRKFPGDDGKRSEKKAAGKPAARGFSPQRDGQLKEGFLMGRGDQRHAVPEPWLR
jgi:hypothetical protein